MALTILDSQGREVTLSSRQPSATRPVGESGDTADVGVVSQTEVQALPQVIEQAVLNLASLIETVNSSDSFKSSVSRVNPPDSVLTGQGTFSNAGDRQRLTDLAIPDSSQGKTMAYCDLKASSENEGPLYVGSNDANVNEDTGRELDPGEPMTITIDNLSKISVYSPNPGNSFSFIVYYEG
jgi:hypothetical protein